MENTDPIERALEKSVINRRHVGFLNLLSIDDQFTVLSRLIVPLKMNANTTRDVVKMLDEVSRRDGVSIDTLLSTPPLADVFAGDAAVRKRRDDFIHTLRRLRYPEFSRIEDAFNIIVNKIKADGGINIKAPRNFEGNKITFSLTAKSPGELAALLGRLRAAVDAGDIGKLFTLLSGVISEERDTAE
ncbi:MAG: hypothetical protein E3J72_06195 [Planctomycetota bacterium]|nr:MAG: hypothetical protein E3J72_06195 [Planctomycetota bacterium]